MPYACTPYAYLLSRCANFCYDHLREKEQFPAVDFAIITPKVGGVNFCHFHSSARGGSRISYLAASTNASAIQP